MIVLFRLGVWLLFFFFTIVLFSILRVTSSRLLVLCLVLRRCGLSDCLGTHRLIVSLELVHDVHQSLKLPVINIGTSLYIDQKRNQLK